MGISVAGGPSYGLTAYPSTGEAINMFRGKDIQGVVEAVTRNKAEQSVTIRTTPDQDKVMAKVLNEALGLPSQRYNLYNRNCAQFVQEVLEAGGVQVSNTRFSHELMNYLQWQHGRGRRTAVPPYSPALGP